MNPIIPLAAELRFLWQHINELRQALKLPPIAESDIATAIEQMRATGKLTSL